MESQGTVCGPTGRHSAWRDHGDQLKIMKRVSLASAASALAALGLALAPTAASANVEQLGAPMATPVISPVCPTGVSPADCYIILTRTTAIQSITNSIANPTKVTKAGWVIAFTVGLAQLSPVAKTEIGYLHELDTLYGGTPQVVLTVLKPEPNGAYTVAAESGTYHLIPFLGSVLQEPLSLPPDFTALTALPVMPGDVLALTVPTWAPVLSYNLSSSQFSYRQSRAANCKSAAAGQTAQLKVGESQRYLCSYTGTRVEYSATEVVNVPYPKQYVH
jgi:hypothetical protein